MSWVAAAVIGSSVISGYMGSKASKDAANIQAKSARDSAAMQKQMFDIQNEQQAPYREAGYGSLNDIANMKPYLQKQFNAQDFQEGMDPGYAFRLKMGQDQAMRQANLGGGALSGNALAGLQDYTQGQASQEYGNAFNRFQTQRGNIYNTLASIAGLGQTSLGQTGQASTATAGNVGNAISNAGSAQAAGTVGSANAWSGAINNGTNGYMLSQMLKPQGQSFTDSAGWSGGGSGVVSVPGQGTTTIPGYFSTGG